MGNRDEKPLRFCTDVSQYWQEMHQRLMELDPKNYDPMKNNKPVVPTKQFLAQKGGDK